MSRDLNAAAVRRLLDALDLGPGRIDFAAKASTSEVWRADTADGPVAVRILAPRPGKPHDIDADVALRRRLLLAGPLPVARPIADHRDRPDLAVASHRPAWAVDAWIAGEPADAVTPETVWRDLGRLLAVQHALPPGDLDKPASGVRRRFEAPWPFDGNALAEHPVTEAAPGTIGRLQRVETAIRAAASGTAVVAHSDLNGANIRHAGGRLTGLIDFADATVLAAAWDFASLRYFHGPDVVRRTLSGYTASPGHAYRIAADATALALVVALHHVSRARTLGLPDRRAVALERLHRDLDALEHG